MKIKVLSNFALGQNHLGSAIFAAKDFKKGDVICTFEGEIFDSKSIPVNPEHDDDRYIQTGKDTFMGPSGGIDDIINHSCDPNTGLKFLDAGIILVAIRDIKIGEEITWDYSTTSFNDPWRMACDCRTDKCRKIIGDFMLLDPLIQKKYRDLDIIPQYLKDYMDSNEYPVYTKGIESMKRNGGNK